ncbi:RrF2 family transcriptional regulator [Arthrobacter glacialis]|uniref:Rrf2 family transcriptional regulator n=1 Tax=Arthrobacter glacialis TaxID=1664 RepID=A0A2S4A1L1_ARTGL|nr:Rrf2 family transcriptional regulator [Arthrobacter glacialis]POH61246.1 Rrf2 family transcriptional regulator [Arthrobacter glacialis]POH75395.1 Rrf2 family transcriptional regulator [Arthrobacter glacialis]
MRINSFSDVSLRLLTVLSSVPEHELPTTRELAEAVGTPYNHVSKAVLKLRQMGLVEAIRGRSGGVRISADGKKATVGRVLRVLDSHSDVAECQTDMGACPLIHECGLRGALNHAREAFYASLDNVTIYSLARKTADGPVPVTLSTVRPS